MKAIAKFGNLLPEDPGHAFGEKWIAATSRITLRLGKAIMARPVTSMIDVVDRAVVAASWMTESTEGYWHELQDECPADRATAETVLAVLQLAGLREGQVERHGRT